MQALLTPVSVLIRAAVASLIEVLLSAILLKTQVLSIALRGRKGFQLETRGCLSTRVLLS